MGELLIAVLGLVGYVVPAPALIWGWWRWGTSSPRFGSPTWRTSLSFAGLLVATVVGIGVLVCIAQVNRLPEGDLKYATALRWARSGFFTAGFGLITSLVGKGPARLPGCLASVGLMSLWLISVITY